MSECQAYCAVYCSLCHAMGKHCGLLSRLFLNYDFTFLAMVLSAGTDCPDFALRRCAVHPLRGCPTCSGMAGMDRAAEESVILTWWKLQDDLADKGYIQSIPARLLCLLLKKGYRNAAADQPAFDREVRRCLAELRRLEQENSPSLDRTADTSARILCAAVPDADDNRPLTQMLYHLGRWIYLIDAWDDLERDRKSGNYNPVLARFSGVPDAEEVRRTLALSRRAMTTAFELAEFGCWRSIIENVLYRGLPQVEELVFSGRWKKAQRAARRMYL